MNVDKTQFANNNYDFTGRTSPYVVVSKNGLESYTIRRSNDHLKPEVRTHSSLMKKYFERPFRLRKPTRNNISDETAPLVLVALYLKTYCSSLSSSSTRTTMIYQTRVCTYDDCVATGFLTEE